MRPARGGDWTTPIGGNPAFGLGPTTTGPAVAGGRVFVGGPRDGKLYALDAATGAVLWSDATASHTTTATTAVVAANGAVYSSRSTGITGHHPEG